MVNIKLKPKEIVFYRLYLAGTSKVYRDMYPDEMLDFSSWCISGLIHRILSDLKPGEILYNIHFSWIEDLDRWRIMDLDIKKIIQIKT